MKQFKFILVFIIALVLINTNLVAAMAQAEIDKGQFSLGYGMQTLERDIRALNLESGYGFSPNFGLDTSYTYKEGDSHYLDLNFKMSIVENPDYDLSAVVGYHTEYNKSDFTNEAPRLGVLYSKAENQYLDLNFGLDFLLKSQKDYLGYTFGFDYMLTNDLSVEVAHRKTSGQEDTEGLNVSLRHYF
ncbi:MAG: outer membrane beta-barrel protein [Bacillota bacterium]